MKTDTTKFDFLYRHSKLKPNILNLLSKSPHSNYRKWSNKKPDGGQRPICAPTKELKKIQEEIRERIVQISKKQKTIHPRAFGSGKRKSYKENAFEHKNNRYFFQVDIKDFFGSINFIRVQKCLSKIFDCTDDEVKILTRLTTYEYKLPQGAPTSPILALLCSRELDNRIANFCKQRKMVYTRYVDDITISSKKPITEEMQKTIRDIVSQEGFTLNESKTKVSDIKNEEQCKINGVIIKDERLLTRYHHGQEKHTYITENTPITIGLSKKLDGVLSFIKQIDPDCYDSLIKHKRCLDCK